MDFLNHIQFQNDNLLNYKFIFIDFDFDQFNKKNLEIKVKNPKLNTSCLFKNNSLQISYHLNLIQQFQKIFLS